MRVLIVEDRDEDAELTRRELRKGGIQFTSLRVETRDEYLRALSEFAPDIILSDYNLPQFDGLEALRLLKESGLDVPFILITGSMTEEVAVDCMKQGVNDYVLKMSLKRLPSAVRNALERVKTERARAAAIDALRESEERYRVFVANSSEAIWRFELEEPIPVTLPADEQFEHFYRFAYLAECNDAMALMYGYARAADLVGVRGEQMLPRADPRIIELFRAFVHSGYRMSDAESVRLDREGRERHFLNNLLGVVKDGLLLRIWGTQRDITERVRAERELRAAEEQLRQSQKLEAVGQLAGGVAHDFNNLLTVITGYSELLLKRVRGDESLSSKVEEIKKAGDRAADLTHQLLAFSRKQVLQPKVLDLNQIITEMDRMLRRLIGEDIDLKTVPDPTLGKVMADFGQIQQVVMNLAVNARDAMPNGGKLTIQTGNVYLDEVYAARHVDIRPGHYVMLAVSDTGTGMDAQTLARIFEPFFTTKEQGKGTGLGLSTVYGIVKQSGGSIWVYSEPGLGTTFKIYLPLAEGVAESPQAGAPRPETGGAETLLLVEDEAAVRTFMSDILEASGYKLLVAGDGAEALSVGGTYRGPIHLLITDVVMPRMGGATLAGRLAPLRPETRVLYISGYTDDSLAHRGVLGPDVAFLEKPFSSDALLRKVREVLDGPPGRARLPAEPPEGGVQDHGLLVA
jgi:two-component system cell cycle sensor histidine kinase/response regulator CckA